VLCLTCREMIRARREEVPSEQFASDKSPIVSPEHATELLGTMQGGYNIQTLVELLDSPNLVLLLLMLFPRHSLCLKLSMTSRRELKMVAKMPRAWMNLKLSRSAAEGPKGVVLILRREGKVFINPSKA
jgi:hypothetical protein